MAREKGMTIRQAQKLMQSMGITLRKTDWGEFRVNYRGGPEATASYTDDLQDAVDTGAHMAKQGFRS